MPVFHRPRAVLLAGSALLTALTLVVLGGSTAASSQTPVEVLAGGSAQDAAAPPGLVPTADLTLLSPEQLAEMADGVVTAEEYHAAFGRYAACVAEGGFEVEVLGEEYGLIEARLLYEAVEAGVDGPCYDAEYRLVDMQWQLDHIDTSSTAEVARRCLLTHGLEVPEHYADMVSELEANGVSFGTCPAVSPVSEP